MAVQTLHFSLPRFLVENKKNVGIKLESSETLFGCMPKWKFQNYLILFIDFKKLYAEQFLAWGRK